MDEATAPSRPPPPPRMRRLITDGALSEPDRVSASPRMRRRPLLAAPATAAEAPPLLAAPDAAALAAAARDFGRCGTGRMILKRPLAFTFFV